MRPFIVLLLGVLFLFGCFAVAPEGRRVLPMRRSSGALFQNKAWKGTILFALVLLAACGEKTLEGSAASLSQPKTAVIAHRAGAAQGPENTLSALEAAIAAGADTAEIDVQETRDGVLIVIHDDSFQRTAGLDQKVWDTDYDMVRGLDAGSSFSSDFSGEQIPSLEEMLAAAKGRIGLMIELKSTGHGQRLAEETVEEIRAAGMEAQCTVASMDLGLLQRTKELAPELETVYITSTPDSGLYDLNYVDGYSIENSVLTEEIVAQIHQKGKKAYGWTVNQGASITRMTSLGVDGLVTDDPVLARCCLESEEETTVLQTFLELLYDEK